MLRRQPARGFPSSSLAPHPHAPQRWLKKQTSSDSCSDGALHLKWHQIPSCVPSPRDLTSAPSSKVISHRAPPTLWTEVSLSSCFSVVLGAFPPQGLCTCVPVAGALVFILSGTPPLQRGLLRPPAEVPPPRVAPLCPGVGPTRCPRVSLPDLLHHVETPVLDDTHGSAQCLPLPVGGCPCVSMETWHFTVLKSLLRFQGCHVLSAETSADPED